MGAAKVRAREEMKDARRSIVILVQSLLKVSNFFCKRCMDEWEVEAFVDEALPSWKALHVPLYTIQLSPSNASLPGLTLRLRHVVTLISSVNLVSPP